MKFLFDLHKDIYEKIWKLRALSWKQFKKDHEITKNHSRDSTQRLRQSEFNNINNVNGYRCPLNDCV